MKQRVTFGPMVFSHLVAAVLPLLVASVVHPILGGILAIPVAFLCVTALYDIPREEE